MSAIEHLLRADGFRPLSLRPRPEWAAAVHAGVGMFDLASGLGDLTPAPSSGFVAGGAGVGALFSGTGAAAASRIVPGISAGITAVMIIEPRSTTVNSNFLFGEAAASSGAYNYGFYSTSANYPAFFVHNGTTGVTSIFTFYDWKLVSRPQVWVATYGDGDNNIRLFVDGVESVAAQTGSIQRNTGAHLGFKRWAAAAGDDVLYLGAVSPRRMPAAEVRARFGTIASTYAEIFEPRRIPVPVSAGGGGGDTGAGGSQATVEASSVGAGVAAEIAAGGSSSITQVSSAGAGTALEASADGSASTVHVTAGGAGVATEVASGGSASTAHVTAGGAGVATEVASGGSASAVEVSAAGAGSAQEEGSASGGSASFVEVSAAGAGTALETAAGGSASSVHVIASGAGTPVEATTGGSSSAVEVAAVGGGSAQQDGAATGGSSSVVAVTSTGGGYAIEFAFGGSQSTVTVTSAGAGQAEESGDNQAGGSASMAVVLAAGAGYATEFAVGGSSSTVQVRAVGYGFAPNTQPRVLSIFERMSATILRTLGKPSYYNGSTEAVMINIEHDVQMAGMGAEQAAYRGDYVANRDIATVPMDLNPRVGDRFVQDGVLWRLESLHSDKGANRRFVVSRVKT